MTAKKKIKGKSKSSLTGGECVKFVYSNPYGRVLVTDSRQSCTVKFKVHEQDDIKSVILIRRTHSLQLFPIPLKENYHKNCKSLSSFVHQSERTVGDIFC